MTAFFAAINGKLNVESGFLVPLQRVSSRLRRVLIFLRHPLEIEKGANQIIAAERFDEGSAPRSGLVIRSE
ncbi:hypothetical protein [Shinella sp. BYT-45]|uniref:hypothetical protein n=1 Tax=Shinella sp. BYT-45 TaxID=3377377 RepID=UPI00397F4289